MARVLVLDDDLLIAMMLVDWLDELDCVAAGPATSEAEALALLGDGLDAAILDVSLGDGDSSGVAAALRARGVPFAFASGYGAAAVPAGFEDTPLLPKPYDFASLERVVRMLLGGP
jgi:CheY-like chemotaxis protein